ncbi:YhdP family phospholipid transporter [Chitinimonas naiadis]
MSTARPRSYSEYLAPLRRLCFSVLHWHGRLLVWLLGAFLLVWLGASAWLQWWFFPHLESYRPKLVAELSQRAGRPIEIASIDGGWHAGLPYLAFQGLKLKHMDGRPALSLDKVDATLAWWPLLIGEVRFARLTLHRPTLALTRDTDGMIRLAGLPLNEKDNKDSTLGNWVLRQHDIAIVDGTVTWQDAVQAAPLLRLDHVDLMLVNQLFGHHRAQIAATPPSHIAAPFRLDLNWQGDDMAQFAQWRGKLATELTDVDLAAWGQWLPYPVEVRRGRGALRVAIDFVGLAPMEIDASLALQKTSLRLAPELAMLDLDTLSTRVRWLNEGKKRQLTLSEIKLSAEGGKLLDGSHASLQLQEAGGGSVEIDGLTLPTLANLPPAIPLPRALRQHLQGMQPTGRIDKLRASWQGNWREPAGYAGQMAFTSLGLNAPAPMPSLGPLDGELSFDAQGGKLSVRGQRFRLTAANVFEAPLAFDSLRLAADWTHAGSNWTVNLRDFAASNVDMDAAATATWRWAGEGQGNLSLNGKVGRLAANKVADYLPIELGPETRAWLKASLTEGEARDASFVLNGPLADFPFADGKTGVWDVATKVAGVTLDYGPGWPALKQVDGDLHIKGNRLSIAAAGTMLGTRVERAGALIEDLAHSNSVHIDGDVKGPSAEFFRFIAASPLDKTLGGLGSMAKSAGEGRLALKLDIPFDNADATKVAGTFRVAGNRLQISDAMPELTDLKGDVAFTEHGVSAKGLTAQALGGPVRVDLSTVAGGTVQIAATGRMDSNVAARRYAVPFADRLSGSSDYKVNVSLPKQGWQLAVEAPLRESRIDLPAPLGKSAGEARLLKINLDATDKSEQWKVVLGNQLNVDLLRSQGASGWRIERGEVHLGSGLPNTANRGLWLTANLPELALDPWLQLLDGGKASADAPALAGVELRTGKLLVAGNQLDDLMLRAVPQADNAWQLTASSKQIEGRAEWAPQGKGRLHARLARLILPLPEAAPGEIGPGGKTDRQLPALDVVAEDFRYKGHGLGKLDVKAQQQKENWLIESLTLVNPDGRLGMQGIWQAGGEDGSTKVKVDIDSDNVGKLLGRFGYPETMRRGSGSLKGELAWRGSPLSPDYPSMSGNLSLKAENGQFAKVEPGVGRLLGILSLQSLQRRLTLDFRDIFSEGFAFDRIEGDSKIVRGVISTDNLVIVGPAAQVLFRGEADIAKETQKLRVRIVPTVGDSLAVGAGVALANPALAVGAFLLQRVLKDPFGQLIAYEYDITGRWDDPQAVRVSSPLGTLGR